MVVLISHMVRGRKTSANLNCVLYIAETFPVWSFLVVDLPSWSRIYLAEINFALGHFKEQDQAFILHCPYVWSRHETPTPATRIYFTQTSQGCASNKIILASCRGKNFTQNQYMYLVEVN